MRSFLLLATLVLGAMVSPRHGTNQNHGHLNSLHDDIAMALAQNPKSYQKYVRDVYHLAQKALVQQPVQATLSSLKKQGFKVPDDQNDQLIDVEYPAADFKLQSGVSLRLRLRLFTYNDVKRTKPTVFKIQSVWVELRAMFDKPFSQIVKDQPFPQGTVLAELLKRPALQKAAGSYKLKEISVTYQMMGLMSGQGWSPSEEEQYSPYVFSLVVSLEKKEPGRIDRPDFSYEAISKLDPLKSWTSEKTKPANFKPEDSFDPIWTYRSEGKNGVDDSSGGGWQSEEGGQHLLERIDVPEDPEAPITTKAYGIGDLNSLPVDTARIELETRDMLAADLQVLSRFKRLRELTLWYADGDPNRPFVESDLMVVGSLTHLEKLMIQSSAVGLKLAKAVAVLPKLEDLTFYGAKVNDECLTALSLSKTIKKLSVAGPYINVNGKDLVASITDRSIKAISSMKQLEELELPPDGMETEAGLDCLVGLPRLHSLRISNVRQPPSGRLSILSKLPQLTRLELQNVRINEQTVLAISRMAGLRSLTFYNVKGLTNKSIQRFSSLGKLEWLSIMDCPGVNSKGTLELKSKLHGKYRAY